MFCPFCRLDIREPEHIILETRNIVVMPTFGQITERGGYTLIIPKSHISCIGALHDGAMEEFEQTVNRVSLAIQEEYDMPVLAFEHGIVGQTVPHAHLHLLPTEENVDIDLRSVFPNSEFQAALSLTHLASTWNWLPYLYWKAPDDVCGVVCVDPQAPKEYLRLVAAELLGRNEYGDWKEIHADPKKKALDLELINDTVRRLRERLR